MFGLGNGHQLAVQAIEDPFADVLTHPDFPQIASFCLGWVFLSSAHHLFYSPFPRYVFSRMALCFSRLFASRKFTLPELETQHANEKARQWSDDAGSDICFPETGHPMLGFLLTLLFAFASLSQFGSLLVFTQSSKGADTFCAFLVAWGGMSSQAARYVGLLILGSDLMILGAKKWECLTFWFWLTVGTVFVFVSNALSIGALTPAPAPFTVSLCFRKHFLPTSITLSIISICLEIYCLIRLLYLLVPSFLRMKHKMEAMQDIRIAQAASLLALDVLTIIPAGFPTNRLFEFIPFSVGAVIVLAAYNFSPLVSRPAEACLTSFPGTRVASVYSRPQSTAGNVLSRQTSLSPSNIHSVPISSLPGNTLTRQTSLLPGNVLSRQTSLFHSNVLSRQNSSAAPLHVAIPQLSYSAPSPRNKAADDLPPPNTAGSDWTIDSTMAKSVKGAVVQTAVHQSRRSLRTPPFPMPVTIGQPSARAPSPTKRKRPRPLPFVLPQIMPNQAEFALQFEVPEVPQEHRRRIPPAAPRITIQLPSDAEDTGLNSAASLPSLVGSDIVRIPFARKAADRTARSSGTSHRLSRFSYLSSRDSLLRHSVTSQSRPSPDSSGTVSPENADTRASRHSTFGESAFASFGFEPPRTPPLASFAAPSHAGHTPVLTSFHSGLPR